MSGRIAMNNLMWKTAAAKFDPETVKKITKMTDRNMHPEALILGATMLGQKDLVKKLKLVLELHHLEGHMPRPLMDYRHILYGQVMEAAKLLLEPDQFETFRSAY